MSQESVSTISKEAEDNERIRLAKKLFSEGVPVYDPSGRVGLHGTSIENFVRMIKTGAIKTDAEKNKIQGETHNNRFYIVPHKESLQGSELYNDSRDLSVDTVFQAAADYASITAFYSYVIERLPGLLDDSTYMLYVLYPETEKGQAARDFLVNKAVQVGFDPELVEKVIREAKGRRGVVLAINKDVLDKFKLMRGEKTPDREIYIEAPEIPFEDIVTGAEPMIGYDKEEIFERLREDSR
ncbi:MAG: hypothetical protein HYW77_00945 [Parcubacteria group bacterium]|nr:hypothetical protein [Parcubacteria group bacterium]